MSADILSMLPTLIKKRKMIDFYRSSLWIGVRSRVLKNFRCECIRCRYKGIVSKAVIVHHVRRLKQHPEFAVSERILIRDEGLRRKAHNLQDNGANVMSLISADGRVGKYVCTNIKGAGDVFVDLTSDEILQLLPVCRSCHHEIHNTGKNALVEYAYSAKAAEIAEIAEKYPERW